MQKDTDTNRARQDYIVYAHFCSPLACWLLQNQGYLYKWVLGIILDVDRHRRYSNVHPQWACARPVPAELWSTLVSSLDDVSQESF